MWGTMNEPQTVPPKGEFFCKNRVEWMPEIPGETRMQVEKEATLTASRSLSQKANQGMTDNLGLDTL